MLDRNKQIYHERMVEKRTYIAIGKKYNITKQRAHQIVSQEKMRRISEMIEGEDLAEQAGKMAYGNVIID